MKSILAACAVIAVIAAGAWAVLGGQPYGAADRTAAAQSVRLD